MGPYLLTKGSKVEGFLGEGESVVVRQGHGVRGYTPVRPKQVEVCRVKVGDIPMVVNFYIDATLSEENYADYYRAVGGGSLQGLCDLIDFPQREVLEILQKHADDRTFTTRDYEVQKVVRDAVVLWLTEKTKGTVAFSGASIY